MLNELDFYRNRPLSYSQEEIQAHYNCEDPWLNPCTDWFGEALKNASFQREANMSVSGGSEAIRYFLSFGGLTEDDTMRTVPHATINMISVPTSTDGYLTILPCHWI